MHRKEILVKSRPASLFPVFIWIALALVAMSIPAFLIGVVGRMIAQ